jgi:hypothetical protein
MGPADLLFVRRLPARLTAEQVAVLLNIHEHDVPVLTKAGILEPLAASSVSNTVKYFGAAQIEQLSRDTAALSRLTRILQNHWRKSNQRRQSLHPDLSN